jgi:DNA-directed RNA polymerase specialized sigma24 family protein
MDEQTLVFNEKILLDAYFKFNDVRSIDILFNYYRFHVLLFINSKISSLEVSEDITQETLIKAYLALDSFQ